MDESGVPTYEVGTVYRVTYADGLTTFLRVGEYNREVRENHLPERLPGHRLVETETQQFDSARWEQDRAGFWVLTGVSAAGNRLILADATNDETLLLPLIPGMEETSPDRPREMTTWGRSDESPGEGNTVVSRLGELADKVRDPFSRYRNRDRGIGM
ncbi:MAG: hypothetical protein M3361_14865 [Candidatus Tectomicrobia bacterium]|nr:hypothetical protein [Candidatus Tectomicrobia bacterium]